MTLIQIDVVNERVTVDGVVFHMAFLRTLIEMARAGVRVDMSMSEAGDSVVLDQVLDEVLEN